MNDDILKRLDQIESLTKQTLEAKDKRIKELTNTCALLVEALDAVLPMDKSLYITFAGVEKARKILNGLLTVDPDAATPFFPGLEHKKEGES